MVHIRKPFQTNTVVIFKPTMCEKQGYCVPVGVLNSFMSAVMVHAKHQKLS